jgi:centriolar protein POC1
MPSPARKPTSSEGPKTQPLEVRKIPDEFASSLQQIVRQMDILTQTMSILEVII